MSFPQVSIIGGGAWGTAIAHHLACKGVAPVIWTFEKEVADDINRHNVNSRFLVEIELNRDIRATTDLAVACKAGIIFFVVPSLSGISMYPCSLIGKSY
ncbi:MAG: hypothetical protein IEMM0002_0947 [bacterium]|nr:MAG: hypothetical protein IEMM0002_0947 [bacterium]